MQQVTAEEKRDTAPKQPPRSGQEEVGGLQARSRDAPAARDEDPGEAGCAPSPRSPRGRRFSPHSPGRTPHWGRGMPEGAVTPGQPLAGLVPPWGPLGPAVPGALHLLGGTPQGSARRAAARGKGSRWRGSWRAVSCGRDPARGQGQSVRMKEQQRQSVMD